MSARWVTPAAIRAKVQRRFGDGTLLTAFAVNAPFPTIEVPLRGPGASDIGDDLGSVQRWVAALDAGSHEGRHYSLVRTAVGGRHIGRNVVPSRAIVDSYEQAWALLGVTRRSRPMPLSSLSPATNRPCGSGSRTGRLLRFGWATRCRA